MKSDLDRLMTARELVAIVVTGGEHQNTPRAYLCNGVDIHNGMVIKKLGAEPVLIVGGMEIEEAGKSGVTVVNRDDLGWAEIYQQTEGDPTKTNTLFWGRLLEKFEIPPGKIGVYGVGDLNIWIERARELGAAFPDNPIVGETGLTLFDEAFVTKDAAELDIMRDVADKTCQVLQAAWDYIGSHRAEGDTVVKDDGAPLTIGDVKRFVRRELMDRELEDTDMIFAQGRDAGFPHSRGQAGQALKLGQPIVFDLFPRQLGGGYFHDCTRTWSIGYATEAVQDIYNQVMTAFQTAVDTYAEPGQPTHTMQDAVLDYYEANGHPTNRSKPGTSEGYVHSLGHGVGLNIHERPSISHLAKEDIFQKGNFITIEPGLYYPDRGLGVRVEDSFIIGDDGELISLTPFRKDLVLPLRG
ncbi:MAG: M24 family metallopeptidase [Chloroflexota bacterium]